MSSRNPLWDRILSAAQRNDVQTIHNLINQEDVDVNHANQVGQSALHVAALWGHYEAVEALLSHSVNVNAQNTITGATAIHSAIQSNKEPAMGRVICVKRIMECGGNVHIPDKYGMSAMESFDHYNESNVDHKYVAAMREVLALGGGAGSGRLELLDLIDQCREENGVNALEVNLADHLKSIDEKDGKTGMTALIYSVTQIVEAIEKMMEEEEEEEEEKEDAKDDYAGQLQALKDVIFLLLENGCDPNQGPRPPKDTDRKETLTAMYTICKALNTAYTESSQSSTSSSLAFSISTLEKIAVRLLKSGAEVSKTISLLMHDAARRGNIQTIQFWVDQLSVDPDVKGRQGLTAMHFAARSGRLDIIRFLMPKVGVNGKDERGKTALEYAVANNKEDAIKLLRGET